MNLSRLRAWFAKRTEAARGARRVRAVPRARSSPAWQVLRDLGPRFAAQAREEREK